MTTEKQARWITMALLASWVVAGWFASEALRGYHNQRVLAAENRQLRQLTFEAQADRNIAQQKLKQVVKDGLVQIVADGLATLTNHNQHSEGQP